MQRGATTARGRASRDAILDAAVVEFTTNGYRGSSVNSIARRAQITKSGLLHHFASKEALLAAVLSERTAQNRAPQPSQPDDRLFAELAATVAHNQHDESWVRFFVIMVAESFTHAHPAFDVIRERYQVLQGSLATRFRDEYPQLDRDRAQRIASLTTAVLDGLQVLRLADPGFDMRPVAAEYIDAITPLLGTHVAPEKKVAHGD